MNYNSSGKSLRTVILERSIPNGLCWNWTGPIRLRGWGYMAWQGKSNNAHIFAYNAFKGEIPPGMVIDHLCRNRLCVNPEHLEAVTSLENIKRGSRQNLVCLHGHHLKYPNVLKCYDKKYGIRFCKKCHEEGKQIHKIYHK